MSLCLLHVTLVAALASTTAASLAEDCQKGLEQLQGRSDSDLAAVCRSSFAPEFCREAGHALGARPWSSQRISKSCSRFAAAFPKKDERGLETAVVAKAKAPKTVATPARLEEVVAEKPVGPPAGEMAPTFAPSQEKPGGMMGHLLSKTRGRKATEAKEAQYVEAKTGHAENAEAKSGKVEDAEAKTGKAEDVEPKTGKAENAEAKSGKVEDADAKTGKAEDVEAKTGTVEDGEAKIGKAEDVEAKTGQVEDVEAKIGQAEDAEAKTGKIEDAEAKTGNAENAEAKSGKAENAEAKTGKAENVEAKIGKAKAGNAKDAEANTGKAHTARLALRRAVERAERKLAKTGSALKLFGGIDALPEHESASLAPLLGIALLALTMSLATLVVLRARRRESRSAATRLLGNEQATPACGAYAIVE